jgi:alkylation response protein AidB-like acyl-CoA dehydrogenase
MCLTEPQCGTDLSQVKTKGMTCCLLMLLCFFQNVFTAEPLGDGRFKLNGTKIWISGGDQDMTENVIHIVLARLPNAPPGTKERRFVVFCCVLFC